MIKILKIVGAALGIIIFIAAIFVGVLTVTEYKPQDSEDLTVTYNDQQATQDDSFPTDTNKLSQQKKLSIGVPSEQMLTFSWMAVIVCTHPPKNRC